MTQYKKGGMVELPEYPEDSGTNTNTWGGRVGGEEGEGRNI